MIITSGTHTMSGVGQSRMVVCGAMVTPFGAMNGALCAATTAASMRAGPGAPFTITPQSRPADMNRSYMPYTTEAVVSGMARIATLGALGAGGMADLSGCLPKRL